MSIKVKEQMLERRRATLIELRQLIYTLRCRRRPYYYTDNKKMMKPIDKQLKILREEEAELTVEIVELENELEALDEGTIS